MSYSPSSSLIGGLLILAALAVGGSTASASDCPIIPMEPVEPVGRSPEAKCDSRDKLDCQIKKAFAKFGKTPQGRLKIRLSDPPPLSPLLYLGPILDNSAVQEVLRFRKKARALSGWKDVCQAIPVYIGPNVITGLGPALMDSVEFDLEGQRREGLLLLDDGKIPYIPFIASISKISLIRAGYYEYVVAHELAHGLMQDLYGIPRMKMMTSKFKSRAGHFASAVTDPALAWVEGFAEGFEAYLTERHPREGLEKTPHLDRVMRDFVSRADTYEEKGALRYYLSVPAFIPKVIFTIFGIDDLMADFIKAERGQALRDGFYVQKGTLNNLTEKFPEMMVDITELDAMLSRTPESLNQLYSKEGVVAFAVYSILQAKLGDRLMEMIKQDYPMNSQEFFNMVLRRFSDDELAKVRWALAAILTPDGRAQLMRTLPGLPYARGNTMESRDLAKHLRGQLAKLELPVEVPPPVEYWVEFEAVGKIRRVVMGELDRINLLTEPESRIHEFLKWALKDEESSDEEREALVAMFAQTRDRAAETRNPLNVIRFWDQTIKNIKHPHLEYLAKVIYRRLHVARGAYLGSPASQP